MHKVYLCVMIELELSTVLYSCLVCDELSDNLLSLELHLIFAYMLRFLEHHFSCHIKEI
jgi:hypothetical protein